MESLAGGVLGAAASFYGAYSAKSSETKARRLQKRIFGQQMLKYEESQAKIWGAYNAEVERQGRARSEYMEAQTQRWQPYIESQKRAIEAYQKAAYEPEISPYATLRMEESEKAINKELARRGILFSGAAAELKEKSRRTIAAEETERAKGMLEKLATGISPMEPGYIAPAQVGIPGGPGVPGAPSISPGGQGVAAGVTGGVNALMAGLYGYQQARGYKGAQQEAQYYGRQTGAPTGLYGGSVEGYAPPGW